MPILERKSERKRYSDLSDFLNGLKENSSRLEEIECYGAKKIFKANDVKFYVNILGSIVDEVINYFL